MRRLVAIALLAILACASLYAQDRGVGVGIMIGSPTGLNGKLWMTQKNAVDLGLAWDFTDDGYFHIHGDYLWHFPNVFQSNQRLVLYTGIGARFGFSEKTRVGVRIPFGIEWWPRNTPLDVFLELVPVLDLAPKSKFAFNGGVGVRFFFD
jgi:hypothetical protein